MEHPPPSVAPVAAMLAISCLLFPLCLLLIGSGPPPVAAAEQEGWTQWRGPARDGVVSAESRAGEWPEQLVLLWEQEVGEGYSGPVVSGDRVWVHSRRGEVEVVSSLTLGEGRTVWRRRYEVPFEQDHDALQHGRGPYATPTVADGRLFSLGVTSVLSAWNAQSGGLLWRRDYSEEFERHYAYFGTASSPLVWGELCFVHFGSTMGQESDAGAMIALDVADGGERWRWDGDAPAIGASPAIREISGRLHLVFKSKEHIVGLDPSSGEELWRIRYKVSQDNTIVTPLFLGDQLVTSDWDMGMHSWQIERELPAGDEMGTKTEAGGGTRTRAEAEGGGWRARKLWHSREASIFTSSPVLVGEKPAGVQVVGFSHFRRGQLFGMDPSNGEVLWRGEGRSGEHVSLVVWGDDLLAFLEDGSLVVGQVGRDGLRPSRVYDLGDSVAWTHPAIVGNRIIVKAGSRLAVYTLD